MPLSAPAIVETAHRLLLDYGLQDVSMRRLAAELDVRPGALYYHVPNKQQLLARVAQRILAPLSEAPATQGLESMMRQFRDTVLPIRDGADLMFVAFGLDPRMPPVPVLCSRLEDLGLSPERAADRAQILIQFALGAVAAEQNASLLDPDAQTPGGAALFDEGLRLLVGTSG